MFEERQEKVQEQLDILSSISEGNARQIEGSDELIIPTGSERTKSILSYDFIYRKNKIDEKIFENFEL